MEIHTRKVTAAHSNTNTVVVGNRQQASRHEVRHLGELSVYPFGEGFLLYGIMFVCGTERSVRSGWQEKVRSHHTVHQCTGH